MLVTTFLLQTDGENGAFIFPTKLPGKKPRKRGDKKEPVALRELGSEAGRPLM